MPNSYACAIPPTAQDGQEFLIENDAPITITLVASDDQDPGPQPLTYAITVGPFGQGPTLQGGLLEGGSLNDPNSDPPNADVTYGGALDGNEVVFTPLADTSGWYAFQFRVNDGVEASNTATVHLFVQESDGPVITEIMYHPTNVNASDPRSKSDWQWLEVYNPGPSAVSLRALVNQLLDVDHSRNLLDGAIGQPIPATSTAIIGRAGQEADLADEWSASVTTGDVLLLTTDSETGPFFGDGGATLLLFGFDGKLLDYVVYENGLNGWPLSNERGSIFLEDGHLTSMDNDDGNNWKLSVASENGVYNTVEDECPLSDSDAASPMILPTAPTVVLSPPTADSQAVIANLADGSFDVTLTAYDPEMDPLAYVIDATPIICEIGAGPAGTLSDPNGGGATVNADDPLVGDTVTYHPAPGVNGVIAFAFKVNDGTADSNVAYVTINMQATDKAAITEIMYNPRNEPDNDWEWIEITNLTGAAIGLHTIADDDFFDDDEDGIDDNAGNLVGTFIPSGKTMVIAANTVPGGRTLADFITEWSPLSAGDVIAIDRTAWPTLANGGDVLRLLAADGSLLDIVVYDDGGAWPSDNGISSIYVQSGNESAAANDDGVNSTAQSGLKFVKEVVR